MIKVLCVFGTRPEAIKMAPVVQELRKFPAQIATRVCVTAQHRQMLDQVLSLFDIRPDYDLNLMQQDQSLAQVTADVLAGLDPLLLDEKPDWVLVQGDTTSAMAAALAAFYRRVKVGHVEAGLRTGNKGHPFPEEVNRRIADVVADLHFAPTATARENLLREGINEVSVLVTGNTVIDALYSVAGQPLSPETRSILSLLGMLDAPAKRSGKTSEEAGRGQGGGSPRLILVTAHRRENFGGPLMGICDALTEIARRYSDVRIVYPVHLNPNVQGIVHSRLGDIPNITLTGPVEYLTLVQIMQRSHLVLTDSGGLQEEAPAFGVPVLVMRKTTERPEAVEAGIARLVGTDADLIISTACRLLDDEHVYTQMAHATNPFGDGHASERVVRALGEFPAVSQVGEACTRRQA